MVSLVIASSLLALGPWLSVPQDPAAPADYGADIEALWELVDEVYAYPELLGADWTGALEDTRARARACESPGEFLGVLEGALARLADHHAHLGVNGPDSPALIPSGTDLWAQWQRGRAVVTAVRGGSAAESAGLTAGGVVLDIDGLSAKEALARVTGRDANELDDRQRDWALRTALAGKRGSPRVLRVVDGGEERTLTVEPVHGRADTAPVSTEKHGDVGYIRIADALGDTGCIDAFDAALEELRDTRALVVDLRDTPGGGNSTVARGILGRFVASERPYQRHVLPSEERTTGVRRSWLELVSPRGPFRFEGPVVVLVGRWTGSMGEGIAIAFEAFGAELAGGPMGGLRGAIQGYDLPVSGFSVRLPFERLTHIDGRPRETFDDIEVVNGGPSAVLAFALQRARRKLDEQREPPR